MKTRQRWMRYKRQETDDVERRRLRISSIGPGAGERVSFPLDGASRRDAEEGVMQARPVCNGLEIAGRKSSGMDKVRVEGFGRDEVLDDIA
jgi:hypothetical protein